MLNRRLDNEALRPPAGLLLSKETLRHWLVVGLDILFPPRCAGCGRVDAEWCERCAAALAAVPVALHHRTLETIPVASTGEHTGLLQRAVQALKYENTRILTSPLSQRLAAGINQLEWPVEAVVPVPLHESRLQARGYNQAQLLAEALSRTLGIPCYPDAVRRVRATRSQVGLNGADRRRNVQDAFAVGSSELLGKTVLVVDDVCTTGATLLACAQALHAAGARAVYAVTVTAAQS